MQCEYLPKSFTSISTLEVIAFIEVNDVTPLDFR